jgi:Secretion system C-terminal sorting domain/Fibronectin type III domain
MILPNITTKLCLALALVSIAFIGKINSQIYYHDFGTVGITAKPYTGIPTTLNTNLSNSMWTTNATTFTNLLGNNSTVCLSIDYTTPSRTVTLTFAIEEDYSMNVTSFNFWQRKSGSSASDWAMTINGIATGAGTFTASGGMVGQTNVSNPVANITGTVTVVFTFTGGSAGNNRIDDFTLNGTVTPLCPTTSLTNTSGVYSRTKDVIDGEDQVFYTTSCNSIGRVTDGLGGSVPGLTTMNSNVLVTIPAANAQGYISGRRSFTITPTVSGPLNATFYFTQEDFNNYNASNPGFLDLPTTGSNSDPNINHFRMMTSSGAGDVISGPQGVNLSWDGSKWVFTTLITDFTATYKFTTMPSCENINISNVQVSNVTTTSASITWNNVVTFPTWGWFSVQYRLVGSPTWTFGGTTNNNVISKNLTNLLPGNNYEAQVRRHCSSQSEGPWSSTVLFSTISSGCGSVVNLNPATTSTATTITFTWPSIPNVAWYEFRYKNIASSTWISAGTLSGSATSKTLSGLTSGASYHIEARVFCTSGATSAWSSSITASATSAGCSVPPAIADGQVNSNFITINWAAVSGAGWYSFQYKESTSGTWISGGTASPTTFSKIFSNLLPFTSYDFQGRTHCSNGEVSPWSATRVANTTGVITCQIAPVINSTADTTSSSIKFSWPAVVGVSWYAFQYKESTSGIWISGGTASGASTSKQLNGLLSSTSYDIQGRSYCSNGIPGPWGPITSISTDAPSLQFNGDDKPVKATIAVNKMLNSDESSIQIFPNPFSDHLQISLFVGEEMPSVELKIFDMSGRLVKNATKKLSEGNNSIYLDTQVLKSGIYTIFIYHNEEMISSAKVYK